MGMNKDILKKPTFWFAVAMALAGVAMSQGLVLKDSTPAQIIGWIMTIIGPFIGGQTAGALPAAPAPAPTNTTTAP